MESNQNLCIVLLFSVLSAISGQSPTYPNYGQLAYPNIPTEIIDLPNGIDHQKIIPPRNFPVQPQFKPNNYGYFPYSYPFGGYYPSRHPYPRFPQQAFPQNQQGMKQLPKHMFRNPTPEFPNGYYVVPGSQRQVEILPDDAKKTVDGTTQEVPGYVIKQTSQRYQTPQQNPIKITSTTVEHKPFHTVLTRYIDSNGKPVIKLHNENGTMTLDGSGSTNLNINNGKLEINGKDPNQLTTTEPPEITTDEPEDATPKDVASWIG